jgi:hypothetical protein
MLTELHDLVRGLVHERGRINPTEVDISFESPSRTWIDGLVRPTLNFALVDIQENMNLRHASPQTTMTNGHAQVRMPPRRVDLRYVVTALTSDTEDSHRLLWRALSTLMRTPELPVDELDESIRDQVQTSIIMRVAQPDAGINILDLWSSAGSEARPSFCCVITVPVELGITRDLPLVLSRASKYLDKDIDAVSREYIDVGGFVRDRKGQPLADVAIAAPGTRFTARSDEEGRYVLRNVPTGMLRLQVVVPGGRARRVDVEVPSTSYDLQLG